MAMNIHLTQLISAAVSYILKIIIARLIKLLNLLLYIGRSSRESAVNEKCYSRLKFKFSFLFRSFSAASREKRFQLTIIGSISGNANASYLVEYLQISRDVSMKRYH